MTHGRLLLRWDERLAKAAGAQEAIGVVRPQCCARRPAYGEPRCCLRNAPNRGHCAQGAFSCNQRSDDRWHVCRPAFGPPASACPPSNSIVVSERRWQAARHSTDARFRVVARPRGFGNSHLRPRLASCAGATGATSGRGRSRRCRQSETGRCSCGTRHLRIAICRRRIRRR